MSNANRYCKWATHSAPTFFVWEIGIKALLSKDVSIAGLYLYA